MRELAADSFHWVLWQDETNGALYLEALCNQSAAYFCVEIPLLETEVERLFDAQRELTQRGRKILDRLADAAQVSPSKFHAKRLTAWQAAGFEGPPSVPLLRKA